jgi:hypothetical protein
MKELSRDAAELLREILADPSIHRGVSFMLLSQTRGVYTGVESSSKK